MCHEQERHLSVVHMLSTTPVYPAYFLTDFRLWFLPAYMLLLFTTYYRRVSLFLLYVPFLVIQYNPISLCPFLYRLLAIPTTLANLSPASPAHLAVAREEYVGMLNGWFGWVVVSCPSVVPHMLLRSSPWFWIAASSLALQPLLPRWPLLLSLPVFSS